MGTEAFEGLFVETRNYGATAAFWASLGFRNVLETDHGSGHWEHPAGGPYVFIVEQHDRDLEVRPVLRVADAAAFRPEREPDWVQPFTPQHWGVLEAVVRDPDGRSVSLLAPLPAAVPDHTAVRVALWRALHLEADAAPPVFEDGLALRMADPEEGWRSRPDMDADGTRTARATIVARCRFVEDLVVAEAARGVEQYVILGAGLDTFVERRPDVAAGLTVFEVDQPGHQAWKRQRLLDLGLGVPDGLRLVPVDFEAGGAWWDELLAAGFDAGRPAVVASLGVSMYLTREAIAATLRQVAALAPGSTLVMTFQLPTELIEPEMRPFREFAERGAAASGTPFLSYLAPEEVLAMATDAGFRTARHVTAAELNERWFADRADGMRLSRAEELLVAST